MDLIRPPLIRWQTINNDTINICTESSLYCYHFSKLNKLVRFLSNECPYVPFQVNQKCLRLLSGETPEDFITEKPQFNNSSNEVLT